MVTPMPLHQILSVQTEVQCLLCPLLQDQWGHVEEIELMNDGSGLGFGIVGGKMTGVVVRTLIPGSVADKVGTKSSDVVLINFFLRPCEYEQHGW